MEKDEFNRLFGEFVRTKRESLKWTQNDLASKLNNNFQNISRLERGEINPSMHWINQLAEAFETTLGELTSEFDSFVKSAKKVPSKTK